MAYVSNKGLYLLIAGIILAAVIVAYPDGVANAASSWMEWLGTLDDGLFIGGIAR